SSRISAFSNIGRLRSCSHARFGPLHRCSQGDVASALRPDTPKSGWQEGYFGAGRVGGPGPGGVGRVVVEPRLEVSDLLLEGLRPSVILVNEAQDRLLVGHPSSFDG